MVLARAGTHADSTRRHRARAALDRTGRPREAAPSAAAIRAPRAAGPAPGRPSACGDLESLEEALERSARHGGPAGRRARRVAARPGAARRSRVRARARRSSRSATPRTPTLLAQIPDPPPAFWVAGRAAAGPRRAVAIVGSRTATPHGLAGGVRGWARTSARAGVCVVSGLARGVDGAAHRGALRAGGPTVAVLGCGVDVDYPPEHARAGRARSRRAARWSASSRRARRPGAGTFPRRNRIISGLCARRRRRRGLRPQRVADHRALRAGAGAGRDGRPRRRPERPQPRRARPAPGRRAPSSRGWRTSSRSCAASVRRRPRRAKPAANPQAARRLAARDGSRGTL